MTNKEAIEVLRKIDLCVPTGVIDPSDFYLALALAIKALEERQQGEWIPVTERVPEEEADYEITLNNKQVTIDHAVDGKFMFHNGDVIAWKPLPEPYKEGDKE